MAEQSALSAVSFIQHYLSLHCSLQRAAANAGRSAAFPLFAVMHTSRCHSRKMMGKNRKKGQRRVGQCAYCSEIAEVSVDHVIPRCLFPKPRPSNLITVRACDSCNNTKSKDDDYLRDMLTIDIDCSNSPNAQMLLNSSVIRSVQRGRSAIGRAVGSAIQFRPRYTPSGLYLGTYPSIPLEGQRITHIFSKIVKGLYYSKFQDRLPDESIFEILRIHPLGFPDVWEALQQVGCNGP
jgi:hypothetical protein